MTDTTIDLYPANVDGNVVYIVPPPLSPEALRFWFGVLMMLGLAKT